MALLFNRGKLKGVRYYDTCCRALYDMAVSINSKYQNEPLFLDGVKLSGKSFEDINKSLPYDLGEPDYRAEVATDEATIKFGFTGTGRPGTTKQEFNFGSIEIDYEI